MMMNNKIKTRRRKIKILNQGNRDRTSSKILSQNNQKTFNKNKTHIRLGYHNCNKQKFRFLKHRNGISSRQQKTILVHNCDNQKSKK
jgi:mRNA-degrading endonuclease RelE of RelBE toxin-antitoxin system